MPGYGWMFPARRRHREHRCRRAVDDEGLQAAQPQHAPRQLRGARARHVGARPVPRTPTGVAPADERRASPRPGLGRDRRRRGVDQPDERRGHRLRPRERHAGRRPVPRRPATRRRQSTTTRSASASTGSCAPAAGSASSSAIHGCSDRPAVRRRHAGGGGHHAAGDGQPRRLATPGAQAARCESPTVHWRSPIQCYEEPPAPNAVQPCAARARRLRWGRCGEAQIA